MQRTTVYPVFLAVMVGAVVPGPAFAQVTDFPLAARPRAFMAIAQRDLARQVSNIRTVRTTPAGRALRDPQGSRGR
jgi:hypothetical protein